MFSAALKSGAAAAPVDPDFDYVTMLLHGDGTNGAQNNTFLDSSTNNFTITRNGNTTQGSFSPYGPNWSNFFDGSGDYLTTATSASAFSFGTGDFTIEFWINSTQTTRCDPVGQDTNFSASGWWGLIGNLSSSGQLQWFENANSRISATATNWNNGSWNHIAVTRSGNSVRMFVNGTQVGSTYTTSFTYGDASVGVIAGVLSGDKISGPLTGYLSNLRIVKGTALYTGTFTPSTTPLTAVSGTSLLTCADNRFIDDSTNNFTITRNGDVSVQRFSPFAPTAAYSTATIGGSGYFDGSGDWLNYTGSTISTSVDFTFSIWFYHLGTMSGNKGIFCASNARFGMLAEGGNNFYILASTDINTSTPIPINQWNHLAITRTSGTLRAFLNGTQVGGTASNSQSLDSFRIGSNQGGEIISNCYMSDARVLIGTGGTSVSVPTAPQTAITNTNFLCNFTNGAIFDNAMMNDLETVGNAQISTSVVKYGTGSLAFDGTGDWLTAPANRGFVFGSGNFTVEAWVYPTTGSGIRAIVGPWTVNGAEQWLLYLDGAALTFSWQPHSNAAPLVSGGTVSTNVWTHVAVVRNGNTFTLYVNGTSVGSATSATTLTNSGNLLNVGSYFNGANGVYTGYIDDIRITNGVARYTANFTPPTAAFPDR